MATVPAPVAQPAPGPTQAPASAQAQAAAPPSAPTSAPELSDIAQAVSCCIKAYQKAYSAQAAKSQGEYSCQRAGAQAYRFAIPTLETQADVRALIACVAQGINLQIYENREASQLLYAAQVALASFSRKGTAG